MDDPFQVRFSKPRNGWIDLEVHTKGAAFKEAVSYAPNDFVFELATALSLTMQGAGGVAVAYCEPVTYRFTFSEVPGIDMILLRIVESGRGGTKEGRGAAVISVHEPHQLGAESMH